MEKLTKEEALIEEMHDLYEKTCGIANKLYEYHNGIVKNKDRFYETKEYKFFEIARMCFDIGCMCSGLSLMRDLALEIRQERTRKRIEGEKICMSEF